MKGNILVFDATTNTGKISGHDGIRYGFTRQDWSDSREPKVGMQVDFENNGSNAKEIIVLGSLGLSVSGEDSKSRTTYILLACFLGGAGAHNFWAKRTKIAVIQLILSITVFGLIISMPWVIIDMFTVKEDGNGTPFK